MTGYLALLFVAWVAWTNRHRAPGVPTPIKTVRRMLAMAAVRPDDVVYDLGCGDGRMIITAARRFGARAIGIELDPLRFLLCQMLITVLGLRSRVRVVYGDFFRQDLSDADLVTCYLLQRTNEKLEGKLTKEPRPATRVVSNSFTFPGLRPLRRDDRADLYPCSVGP